MRKRIAPSIVLLVYLFGLRVNQEIHVVVGKSRQYPHLWTKWWHIQTVFLRLQVGLQSTFYDLSLILLVSFPFLFLCLISCPISFCPFHAHALSSRVSHPLKQALQRSLYLHAGLLNDLLIAVVSSKANFGPGLNYKKSLYLWIRSYSAFEYSPGKKGVVFWKGV